MAHGDVSMTNPPERRVGAVALLRDHEGKVLIVNPTYKAGWILPGGSADADEMPHVAVLREVAEEVGLVRQPGRLVAIDYVRANPDNGSKEGLNFVFDLGRVHPDDIKIGLPDELAGWLLVPTDQLANYCEDYQVRRILQAVYCADNNGTRYLVHGQPIEDSVGPVD